MNETSDRRGQPGAAGDWLTPGRFALILALLIFASFPQVCLGLQTFVVRDFGFFAYPLAHYQRECFWRGEIPLWNPYNNCGVPFLAQWNTMPLYPPALIYLALPLAWSLSFFCLLHLFSAGLGMYFLAQRWTGSRLAASVAGVVFAFNGLSLNMLMWPSHIATLSWMPWVVLLVERAWQEGGRKIVWAAIVGALQMLAGGPETILLTWLFLLALWTVEWVHCVHLAQAALDRPSSPSPRDGGVGRGASLCASVRPASSRSRLAFRFGLVVALLTGLAAAQLLPFLDLAAHSQREQGYADTRWSLPGWGWANFLVPMVFGHVWNMGVFFQYDQAWTSSYYLGAGALLLALLGVWTARERRVWMLAAAAGAALVLAFGEHSVAYRWLRHLIPQLSLMTYPVKFVTMIAFIAPLLAGFGLARLPTLTSDEQRAFEKRLVSLGAVLLALIGVILVWAWKWPFPGDDFSATLLSGLSRAGFLTAAAGLVLLCQRANRAEGNKPHLPSVGRVLPLLLLLLFWFDVFTHQPTQNPTVPPSVYQPGLARTKLEMKPQPALGQSRAMVSPAAEKRFTQFIMSDPKNNFLVKRLGYFADCNLLDDVPKVNGFFSLYPRECGELNSVLYGSTNAGFPRLADFLSVSQITAATNFLEWVPRDTFLPMVTAGQRPVYLDDTNAVLALLRPDFDGGQLVMLPPEAKPSVTVTNQSQVRVAFARFSTQSLQAEIEASAPSLVVCSQTFYHDWRAYVDGKPTRLLRANYAFQALEVPAGRHQVRLAYEDGAFRAGSLISCLSLAACLVAWLRILRRPETPATL